MDQQMGLLDRLARMSGCACLSDLRTPAYRHPVLDALGRISAEEYPAKEWLGVSAGSDAGGRQTSGIVSSSSSPSHTRIT